MANQLYDKGREGFLDGSIDFDTDDVRVFFLDEDDDAPVLTTDDNLDDVLGAARVGTATALASKTVVDGVADAADTTLTSVTGDQSESIVTYQHTGTESTSRLICNHDTGTGLPFTPNGGNATIQWNASGCFTL